ALTSTVASADPPRLTLSQDDAIVTQTRTVVRDHARAAHRGRTIAGVSFLAIGAGIGALGYYTYTHASPGELDWAGAERVLGATLVAVGGFVALTSPFALFLRTEEERLHDGLEAAVARGEGREAALQLRSEIGRRADGGRRARRLVRGVGYTLAGSGALAVLAGVVG